MADDGSQRTDRDPRLLDPHRGRRLRTWRRGASCSAPRSGSRRCPRGSSRSPAGGASAASTMRATSNPTEPIERGRSRPPQRRGWSSGRAAAGRRDPEAARGASRASPPAPDRSRSTPSAHRDTATPRGPTSSSSAERAPARADRPDRVRQPRRRWTRRSTATSGSCTPRPRTCRACRGRALARRRCSTPSSPAGCSATPASGWPRSSRSSSAGSWPRSTRRPTGRPARCRSRGWSTPPSTSRCSSSCATARAPSSRRPARASGRSRSSRTCVALPGAEPRPEPWRRTSGMHRARGRRVAGRGPRALARRATRSPTIAT